MRSILIFFIFYLFSLGIKGNSGYSAEVYLYVFEGSDWCTNCARLEKKILGDPVFIEEISLLHVKVERIDFPQRKKLPADLKDYNERIAEKFGFDGTFPTLILFREDTDRSSRIFYHNQSVEEILQMIRTNLRLLDE